MKPGTTAVAGARTGTARVDGSRSADVAVAADVTVAVAVAAAVAVAVLRDRLGAATGLDLPVTQRDRDARPLLHEPVAVAAAAAAEGRRTARGGARPHESSTLPSTGRAFALTPALDSGQPSTSTPRSRP